MLKTALITTAIPDPSLELDADRGHHLGPALQFGSDQRGNSD